MGEPEWRAARDVIESGWITQGPKVAEFERAMAAACEARHAVAVSSCTTALHLALLCAGVGYGDEVIVPSLSFIATANAVVHAGGVPVFAEVDESTFNLDIEDARARITPRTKAIVLVHQLGLPADIDGFSDLTRRHGLQLIEDAACAIGSRYRGAAIGSHSELVCFSFHPRKIVTTGDGGMIATSSERHAARLRLLRHHGMSVPDTVRHAAATVVRESYLEVGYNYRMTDLQAAVGIEQLKRLPAMLARRRALAARYDRAFLAHPIIETPAACPDGEWNVQSYAVRLRNYDGASRDTVMRRLLDRGIASRGGVMTAHREPAYAARGALSLPRSEAASDRALILPLYAGLTEQEQDEVIEALQQAVREKQA
ncbi:DegT/DnrJ/EryC1/StrS family aminotransferase [Candidatus Binatia bacterium]|nr:DegT/DnrJ/EryC1/StrS family aminotransferase [Candidatus Binatia bacterium]